MKPIPLIRPLMPDMKNVMKHLEDSFAENTFSNFGPNYFKSVNRLQEITGKHSVLTTTGTAAIQVACSVSLPPGSRVVIPDYTHIGTYVGVRDAGMIPILCKTDELSWTLDVESLFKYKNEFDAFVVVSPFGYKVNHETYEEFARAFKKKIIYDFAGAWGQFPSTSFPVCYSTHATKAFSTGEGGFVLFSTLDEQECGRMKTNFGISKDGKFSTPGFNLKMDEIRCAMLFEHLINDDAVTHRIHERALTANIYMFELGYHDMMERFNHPSASLCVVPEFEDVNQEIFKNKFICKKYYPLLSTIVSYSVKRISENNKTGLFNGCLALPIDVTKEEQQLIIEALNS